MAKHLKNFSFIVFFVLIFSLFLGNVYPIGIGPGRVILDFKPNLKETFTYQVFNNENKNMDVEMYVKGDLEDYVTLSTTSSTFSPGESKTFTYEINLPSELEKPGTYDTRIGALEVLSTTGGQGATVGARAGVELQLWIRVPYPGKYMEISLEAPDAKVGEPVQFTITLSNLGKEDISAKASIELYDSNNLKFATLSIGEIYVETAATKELYKEWETGNIKPGTYHAVATVTYNGKSAKDEKDFRIGDLLIKIIDVYADNILQGTIGKINIEIESSWNEDISDVYAEIKVAGETIKSETINIGPWERRIINAYWDTKASDIRDYDASAIVHYSGKTISKEFTLHVVDAEGLRSGLASAAITTTLPWIALIIVLASLLLYVYKRKKRG